MSGRRAINAILVTAGIGLFGSACGGPPEQPGSEAGLLASAVLDVADAAATPEQFNALFVAGAAPDEAVRERCTVLSFSLQGEPEINGSTAEFDVLVRDSESKPVATVRWSAQRETAGWKLTRVALP